MPSFRRLILSFSSLLGLLAGCAESTTVTTSGTPATSAADSSTKEEQAIREALAKLPEEDRKLVEAQGICPIGKEKLGSMGVPIKVDVDGKPVFICCEGCRTALLAKAEKEKAAAAPAPDAGDSKPSQN